MQVSQATPKAVPPVRMSGAKPVKKPAAPKAPKAVKAVSLIAPAAPVVPAPVQKASALEDRAMLIGLSIRRWHPHATDKTISDEVATNHQSDRSMGKFRKRLLPKDALMPVAQIINSVRDYHYFRTLPWSDDGFRILGSSQTLAYYDAFRKFKAEYYEAVEVFIQKYPQFVAEAKERLKDLYRAEDYPPVSEMRAKFGIEIVPRPIPRGTDLRLNVGNEELARLRAICDNDAQATIDAAMATLWGRLRDMVEKATARLRAYSVGKDGKVEHTFRDSLVTNIIELLDVLPGLNITGNPDIDRFASQIRSELTVHTGTVLRDDEKVRKDVISRADEILSKMSAFMA